MKTDVAIGFADEALFARAQALAMQLNLPIDNVVLPRLNVTSDKLVLLTANFAPCFVDFNSITWQKRHEAGKKQGLVRACKPSKHLRILDATAGWGRDAAVLASFGAEVLMLERSPIMAALLADGLKRLTHSPSMSLALLCVDSNHYLQCLAEQDYPDVIYIDPMHPPRQKSALVKKDMQILQHLLGTDHHVQALIQTAISHVRQRVVVKWPQRLPPLLPAHAEIAGKTVRFDLYFPE